MVSEGSLPSCISTLLTVGLMSHSGSLYTCGFHKTIADTGDNKRSSMMFQDKWNEFGKTLLSSVGSINVYLIGLN